MKEIVGLRRYAFADQRTGEAVEGYVLYLQWTDDDTQGVCCDSVSFSAKKLDGYVPVLGDMVKIGYNQYKRPDFIVKVWDGDIHLELERLNDRLARVEYLYRCEVTVNSELCDLCRQHGIRIRPSMFDRPRE